MHVTRAFGASLVLAGVATGCSVLRPAPITDDLSTWSPVPLPADPRFVQAAASRCGDADANVGGLAVVLQDRRTANTSALLTAAGPLHGSCFLTFASGGAGSTSTNQVLQAMTGPIAVDENASGGVADGTASLLGGRIAPNVDHVQLTLSDGRTATASVGSGHWLVWWPGSASATRLVAFAADGSILTTIDDPLPVGQSK